MTEIYNVTPAGIHTEDDLLLCCARTCMDSERAERMRMLLQHDIDWAYLVRKANLHGLMPLLCFHLGSTCPESVPKNVLDQLQDQYQYNSLKNLFLTGELLRLLNLFETNGIPAMPFKGPVLAASAYENLALRQFSDLDILVHRRDVLRARELLMSQGYLPQFHLTDEQEAAYLRSQYYYYNFLRDDGKVAIDLHWATESICYSFAPDPEPLWERLEEVSLGGKTVLTFPSENLVLLLCLHGAKHFWGQLNWICDIAELIRVHREINWEHIINQAEALNARRMLFLGLFLASNLLGAALPGELLRRMQSDTVVESLAAQVRKMLFRDGNDRIRPFERYLFYLRVMESLGDRRRYCLSLAINPTPLEWSLLLLPASLSFLYYLIRPVRLIGKYGLRLFKKLL